MAAMSSVLRLCENQEFFSLFTNFMFKSYFVNMNNSFGFCTSSLPLECYWTTSWVRLFVTAWIFALY